VSTRDPPIFSIRVLHFLSDGPQNQGSWGGAFDLHVWNLLWTGEEAMKKGISILKGAGFESVEDLLRTAVGFSSKAYQDLPPPIF